MHRLESAAQSGARHSLDVFFTNSARSHPDRPALIVAGESWSYSRLQQLSRSIETAMDLAGVTGSGRNIALLYGRTAFSYAAAIAIMRSNNVYVPLHPGTPAQRLERILTDAAVDMLVIDFSDELDEQSLRVLTRSNGPRLIHNCDAQHAIFGARQLGARSLCAREYARTDREPAREYTDPAAPLAYIIYTSGSTGVPKGVPITHASACSCIEKVHAIIQTTEQDRFSEFSALSFDISISDLFLCWKSGATLCVPSRAEALVPFKFALTNQISVWSSVPSLAGILQKLQLLRRNCLPQLRWSLFCGEALPAELAHAWSQAAPQGRLLNLYGPTECTIYATYYEYDPSEAQKNGVVPIGKPLPGLDFRIVANDRVVENEHEAGELWLCGDQVARGYWNNPTATQSAFVEIEDSQEARTWYRTGDLVSRHASLGLLFKGRIDRQIKLHGFRVELQEIESVLRDVLGCTLIAVVPVRNANGLYEKILAYCDCRHLTEVQTKALCAARLPPYCVPERIYQLDDFPVNNHGKIDYGVLAARTA